MVSAGNEFSRSGNLRRQRISSLLDEEVPRGQTPPDDPLEVARLLLDERLEEEARAKDEEDARRLQKIEDNMGNIIKAQSAIRGKLGRDMVDHKIEVRTRTSRAFRKGVVRNFIYNLFF